MCRGLPLQRDLIIKTLNKAVHIKRQCLSDTTLLTQDMWGGVRGTASGAAANVTCLSDNLGSRHLMTQMLQPVKIHSLTQTKR